MKTSKRIAALVTASTIVLTPTVGVAQAAPAAVPTPINAASAKGTMTPGQAVRAAEAAGMTPQQAREVGRMVQANPAFGDILGSLLVAFRGAFDRLLPFLESLIPNLPTATATQPRPTIPGTQPRPTIPTTSTTTPTSTPPTTKPASEPDPPTTTTPTTSEPAEPTTTHPEPSVPPTTYPMPSVPPTTGPTLPPRPTTTTTATQPKPTIPTTSPTTTSPRPSTPPPPPPGCGVRPAEENTDAFAQELFELINDYRKANGLRPLYRNSELERVAEGWSATMALTNIPGHNPNLRRQVPACLRGVGENVSAGTGQTSPQRVFDGWRNSYGHNINMLRQDPTDIGLGIASNGIWTYGTMIYATA